MLESGMRAFLLLLCCMVAPLWSQENGHAKVSLWVGSPIPAARIGQSIPVAVVIEYEKGWHGYWSNPGEGGMKTEITWKLPAGWVAGSVHFPTPKRLLSGEVPFYGYEGTILLPVYLTSPSAISGPQKIEATVTWLACNEKGCVPGEVTVQVILPATDGSSGHAEAVAAAIAALPAADEKVKLDVVQSGDWLELKLTGAEHRDLESAEIFPVTEQALDPGAAMHWKKTAAGYEARVKKNQYATGELAQLTLVIAAKAPQRALWVEWKK